MKVKHKPFFSSFLYLATALVMVVFIIMNFMFYFNDVATIFYKYFLEPEESNSYIIEEYTVASWDSWKSLSIEYYETDTYSEALAEYNNKSLNDILIIGTTIEIPSLENEEFVNIYRSSDK